MKKTLITKLLIIIILASCTSNKQNEENKELSNETTSPSSNISTSSVSVNDGTDDIVRNLINSFEISKKGGNNLEISTDAGAVAEVYKMNGDESNYIKWKNVSDYYYNLYNKEIERETENEINSINNNVDADDNSEPETETIDQ